MFTVAVFQVNLYADPAYVRAWPGGCGFAKMGSNYAPTLWIGVSLSIHSHVRQHVWRRVRNNNK
jgi:branched-chain amino acid aminotransferase